jgi:hypothetical protein
MAWIHTKTIKVRRKWDDPILVTHLTAMHADEDRISVENEDSVGMTLAQAGQVARAIETLREWRRTLAGRKAIAKDRAHLRREDEAEAERLRKRREAAIADTSCSW